MNIVIPLCFLPSRNKDQELKFSLRSMPPHDNVFIIGRKPNLQNIVHIPFLDKHGLRFKHENIYNKCLEAFKYMDSFLFANDDHYILPGFDYRKYYYQGELKNKLHPSVSEDYKVAVRNTIDYLEERNLPTKYFDVHCPIIYEKSKFPILEQMPPFGYCIKSLYCNINKIEGTPSIDVKIKNILKREDILKMIEGRAFFSSDDNAFNQPLVSVLSSFFPQASRYELSSRPVC